MSVEHARGFDSGYSAAIHDARVEGSRAYHELHKNSSQGDVDSFKIESDERGFELVIETDEGSYRFNCHAMAPEILQEVQRTIGEWWAEGQAVARMPASAVFRCAPEDVDESGGYDISDPKHPEFHSVHADICDSRAGK